MITRYLGHRLGLLVLVLTVTLHSGNFKQIQLNSGLRLDLHHDPLPDSYLLHAFDIENAYQAAARRKPKSGSLYK